MDRPKDPDALIQQYRDKNPGREIIQLHTTIEHSGEDFYALAKTPGRAEWKRFNAAIADADRRPDALETLVRGCVVWPESAEFDAQLVLHPGLAATYGNALLKAAGANSQAEVGKW